MKPLWALVSSLSWEKKRKHTFIMSEADIVGLGNPSTLWAGLNF